MPVGIEELRFYRRPECRFWVAVTMRPNDDSPDNKSSTQTADLCLLTEQGELIAQVSGLKLQAVTRDTLLGMQQSGVKTLATQASLQDSLFDIQWQAQANFGLSPDYLPTPAQLNSDVQPYALSSLTQLEFYQQLLPQMAAVSAQYILCAFEQLGWTWQVNQRFTSLGMAEQLGVTHQHQPLLRRLLDILSEDGLLANHQGGWQVLTLPGVQTTSVKSSVERLIAQYPTAIAELSMLARCGSTLAEVLYCSV